MWTNNDDTIFFQYFKRLPVAVIILLSKKRRKINISNKYQLSYRKLQYLNTYMTMLFSLMACTYHSPLAALRKTSRMTINGAVVFQKGPFKYEHNHNTLNRPIYRHNTVGHSIIYPPLWFMSRHDT